MTLPTRPERTAERGPRRWWSLVLVMLIVGSLVSGLAYASWEMRVCAPPHDWPSSSRDDGGFNNDVVGILADELGANVTYEWTRLGDPQVRDTLLSGACDLVVGVGDGAGGVLSTVPYARLPYVFVTRADAGIRVESLDDPELEELRIGTYPTGVPSLGLESRGIEANVTEYAPVASPGGLDRGGAILDALAGGEIDVAIVFGPDAVRAARTASVEFDMVPVAPEIDVGATLLQHFRTWTIGVRPHDEAFRDRLNLALAARWDDVQQAIADYAVPMRDVQRPSADDRELPPGIGVIVPAATGGLVPAQAVGMAALRGAEFAEAAVARDGATADSARVLFASAPTDAAAIRAGDRLVATEDLVGLVGGFGSEQARSLGRIAATSDVLFVNVAAIGDRLRGDDCRATTFHVEASASMYVDAIVDWHADQGARRFFVVHEDTPEGRSLAARLEARVRAAAEGLAVVGRAAVDRGQFVYAPAVTRAVAADADVVVSLLVPEDHELFVSQLGGREVGRAIAGLPYPESQTRAFLYRLRDAGGEPAVEGRITLWDAALDASGAGDLNDRFASRTHEPMEPTSWATYAAVRVLYEVAGQVGAASVREAIRYLEEPGRTFDLGKGPVSFRPWDHQLRQELYAVRVPANATWSRDVGPRAAFAEVVGTVPRPGDGNEAQRLDRLGRGPTETTCRF